MTAISHKAYTRWYKAQREKNCFELDPTLAFEACIKNEEKNLDV